MITLINKFSILLKKGRGLCLLVAALLGSTDWLLSFVSSTCCCRSKGLSVDEGGMLDVGVGVRPASCLMICSLLMLDGHGTDGRCVCGASILTISRSV